MSQIFQRLELEAFRAGITPRTRESRDWFRSKITTMRSGSINRTQLMREKELALQTPRYTRDLIGRMFMFFYDPKTKDTLPFYDKFPLIVMVGPAAGGFYGLNLHYLPPILRAKMLDGLMDITNNRAYDDTTKFKVRYQTLKRISKLRYYEPCFKHYLTDHVKGRFARVEAPEWEIATFLPTAQWKKSTAQNIYKDSRMRILK